jgi:hypothetical protein
MLFHAGFEVLTVASMKTAVIALMMEAARTSETLVNFYQSTRSYNPEDSHLQCYFKCTSLYVKMIMNSEYIKIWKEVVLGYFKMIS